MKKTILIAAIPGLLTLTACGEAADTAEAPEAAPEADDDNDAPEPVAEAHDEDEPHDESVPHDH
ncbi:hypothetical protein [Sphingopyxis alaskensis]|jgi:hypothetical protein|uniref:hypothetical protein n=1 Tax=Sphingopyxis alaskensis TaxID=117207 RepID=UPI0000551495|nr:hypothetical protein [Sphingopyxis alaskensis]MCM3421075.1 hypothetical protein [Sphingopyxis alaskensis]